MASSYWVKQQALLRLNREPQRRWSASNLAESLGHGRTNVRDSLEELYQEGKIRRIPGGRYTYYAGLLPGTPMMEAKTETIPPKVEQGVSSHPLPALLTTVNLTVLPLSSATASGYYLDGGNAARSAMYRSGEDEITVRMPCGEEEMFVASKLIGGILALMQKPISTDLPESDDFWENL